MSIVTLSVLLLAASAPASSPPQVTEYELLGMVGDLDVRMSLKLSKGLASAGYAYASGTSSIYLTGRGLSTDGSLQLSEAEADLPESFKGKLNLKQGRFDGRWSKGKRSLPFSLRVFARLVPLGGTGPCRTMRVLSFDLPNPALSQALTTASRGLAEKVLKNHCDGEDDFGGRQALVAMTDNLVSVRIFFGNGLSKGSGSESVVLDVRVLPPRVLRLEDGALNIPNLRHALAREADRVLRMGADPPIVTVAGILTPEDKLQDSWSGWAVTAQGLQLYYRQNDWGASGDGTVHALVSRDFLVGPYDPDSRLGAWASRSLAP